MKPIKLLVVANNNIGTGLSGGDRIAVNLIKHWSKKLDINLLGSADAKILFKRFNVLPKIFYQTDKVTSKQIFSFPELILHNIRRNLLGCIVLIKNLSKLKQIDYVYSCSDFYPDLLPALLLRLLNSRIKWIAGYYLFAPNPFSNQSNYNINRQYIRGFIYFLSQIISKTLVKLFADYVFVTSAPDIKQFISIRLKSNKIFVIQGGVDTVNFKKYKTSSSYIPSEHRKYDAVYLGRFHSQKGVIELINIWKLVVKKIPNAKLIMIGNGDLENQVKNLVKTYHLTKNIYLTGFMDGKPKINIFQNSKIVVHPAIYDSGGMAAAEAMSWGLPGVSFDLPALKTYYPKGMVKSKCNNLEDFAQNIILLLTNNKTYHQYSKHALELIKNNWDWSKRFNKIYNQIFN